MAMSRIDGRSLLGKNLVVRPARRQKLDTGTTEAQEVTPEEAKKQVKSVQSKIDLLKKALEEKKKG